MARWTAGGRRIGATLVLAVVLLLGPLAHSHAADTVLYDQFTTAQPQLALQSAFNYRAADDFEALASGWAITQVDVRGFNFFAGPLAFELSVYRPGPNGLPGDVVASAAGLRFAATPREDLGPDVVDYAIPLPAPLVLPPGRYWLSVYAGERFLWAWVIRPTSTGQAAAHYNSQNPGWYQPLAGRDTIFRLHGTTLCVWPFADVAVGHPACEAITQLTADGVIKGYATAPPTFGPDDPVQRAQMAAFLVRALGWQDRPTGPRSFTDFDGLVQELQAAVRILANACRDTRNVSTCVVQGYGDGRFGPTDPVTYAQVISIITRAYVFAGRWTPQGNPHPYSGIPAIYDSDVRTFYAYTDGLGGVPNGGSINWNAPAPRAWVAQALYQAIQSPPTP